MSHACANFFGNFVFLSTECFYFTFDFTVSLVKLNYFIYKWKLFILEFFLDVSFTTSGFCLKNLISNIIVLLSYSFIFISYDVSGKSKFFHLHHLILSPEDYQGIQANYCGLIASCTSGSYISW